MWRILRRRFRTRRGWSLVPYCLYSSSTENLTRVIRASRVDAEEDCPHDKSLDKLMLTDLPEHCSLLLVQSLVRHLVQDLEADERVSLVYSV
jgi:hypothetical protein